MRIDTRLLAKLRRLFRAGKYYLTRHGREELEDDVLFEEDVANAVIKSWRQELHRGRKRRQVRYELEGPALDGRPMAIVCRFDDKGELRVITAWAVGKEE